jgi:replicative DNA helicase
MMDREVIDPKTEYTILGSMIMDKEVMGAAYNRYKAGSLKTRHFTGSFRPIFRWLVSYYANHRNAPKSTIQKVFERRKFSLNAETRELVEDYLERLADEYSEIEDEVDPDYVRTEMLPDFIREKELNERINKAQQRLDSGRFDEAEKIISTYPLVTIEEEDEELGTIIPYTHEDVEDGMSDENQLQEAFRFQGDLHRMVGPLYKSWLVAITGIEKSGKSYVLQEMAYQAALYQKKKVLVINLELSKPVVRNRLWRRISRTTTKRYAGKNIVPIFDCENNQYRICKAKQRHKNKKALFRNPDEEVNFSQIRKGIKKDWNICTSCREDISVRANAARTRRFIPALWFKQQHVREMTKTAIKRAIKNKRLNRLSNLRVKCFPRFSITFDEARDYILRYMDRKKWEPDIIIFDYLDILGNEPGLEGRFDIDNKWKKASGLAGELDNLVLTADQSTKAGRTAYQLDQMSTSESKTKDSHLDVRIATQQTADEKASGLARFNVVFHRHEMFTVLREVIATQRLATANPMVDNAFFYDRGKKWKINK